MSAMNEESLLLPSADKKKSQHDQCTPEEFWTTVTVVITVVMGIVIGIIGGILFGIYFPTEYQDRVYVTPNMNLRRASSKYTLSSVDISNRDYRRPMDDSFTFEKNPLAILVTLDGKKAYLTNEDRTLSVVDLVNNKVSDIILVSGKPTNLVMTPDEAWIYVVVNGAILVIDTKVNTVLKTIPIGQNPLGIAILPGGTQIYVTNGNEDGSVIIINTATNMVVDEIAVGGYSYGVAFTPDGKQAYVTVVNADSVIIDIENRTVTGKINAPPSLYLIAITSDGTKAYISNGWDKLYILHLANNTLIDSISIGSIPLGIVTNRDSTRVYVTTASSLLVIDTETNKVIYTITMYREYGYQKIGSGLAIGPIL
jgi:YVTN family beta-propeller protein